MTAGSEELGDAPPPLQPGDSFRAAARAAMWPQVARILEVEPALRDPSARDELKRYRVATRRLRAAIRVFERALPKRALREIQPELGDLARAVGRVRDLDVRSAALAEWAGDGAANVAPLHEAWAKERAAAATEMEARLDGKRHARLLADLVALVRADDDPEQGGGRSVRDRAGSAIWAGFERLRAAAGDLDGAELVALHDVRILAKRLRYTLEFLAPVLGADRDWLIARLVDLQDHLGELHDADLARTAAESFLEDEQSTLTEGQRTAVAAYVATRGTTVEELRAGVAKAAAPVIAAGFAKRVAKAVLGPGEGSATEPARA